MSLPPEYDDLGPEEPQGFSWIGFFILLGFAIFMAWLFK